ncbi:hypothetical protein [Arcobacter vandammei]|uniref:hypothetical protein n=1 Tax=Arcobacter vandammei TaxID=2782243 RepID=UPI0018DF6C9B|nr:hypothetical protein [Arcobacter vandammei]
MFNNDEKRYQNLLEQIHQLNRQNFLTDSNKIEDLNTKLSNLEKSMQNLSNKNSEKQILILYGITGFNLFLSILSFIFMLMIPSDKSVNIDRKTDIIKDDSILELKKEDIVINENFENIKPIIKKDTSYYCEKEDKLYKIPYTVEIKGKLYKDRFTFILKDGLEEKDCFIKKENL